MKKIYTIICCFFALQLVAQTNKGNSKHGRNIFGELGGPGIISVNYDQRFKNSDNGLGFRVGIGGLGFGNAGFITLPVGINYLKGKENHYFEAGGGISAISIFEGTTIFDSDGSILIGYLNVGYRYLPSKGLTARVFASPLITSEGFWPFYGGVSLGLRL
jgi:hypothetical protein